MSRIGRLPISLPKGVEVIVDNNNLITVKGTLGTLTQKVDPAIKVEVADNVVSLTRETDQKEHRAMHGLYRALIANMVKGVSEGFKTVQEVIGVGYKAQVQG